MSKTKEELAQIHKDLHRALDQLVACYIENTERRLGESTIMDLIEWSHGQTVNPSCYVEPKPAGPAETVNGTTEIKEGI